MLLVYGVKPESVTFVLDLWFSLRFLGLAGDLHFAGLNLAAEFISEV